MSASLCVVWQVAAITEDNKQLEERLDKFQSQYAATLKHWETEARAKVLEERLVCARIAEAEVRGLLRDDRSVPSESMHLPDVVGLIIATCVTTCVECRDWCVLPLGLLTTLDCLSAGGL